MRELLHFALSWPRDHIVLGLLERGGAVLVLLASAAMTIIIVGVVVHFVMSKVGLAPWKVDYDSERVSGDW